jgi:hypothetical protein
MQVAPLRQGTASQGALGAAVVRAGDVGRAVVAVALAVVLAGVAGAVVLGAAVVEVVGPAVDTAGVDAEADVA